MLSSFFYTMWSSMDWNGGILCSGIVVYYGAEYPIRIARLEGKDQKLMEKILKMDLLILDDFGMKTLEGQQQNDFQQILDDRYNRKAVIISSQLPVSDWHALFKNELIADACLDRIVHKSVRFQLKGESLRKKY